MKVVGASSVGLHPPCGQMPISNLRSAANQQHDLPQGSELAYSQRFSQENVDGDTAVLWYSTWHNFKKHLAPANPKAGARHHHGRAKGPEITWRLARSEMQRGHVRRRSTRWTGHTGVGASWGGRQQRLPRSPSEGSPWTDLPAEPTTPAATEGVVLLRTQQAGGNRPD